MPAKFLACVKAGGKVRTKTLSDRKYVRVCIRNGRSYSGEVHTKKSKGKK